MKAISLWQPWATLIAIGAKQIETRGWPANYIGPVAIHASQRLVGETLKREPFWSALMSSQYRVDDLPLGAIVATCNIDRCVGIVGGGSHGYLFGGGIVTSPEWDFGDYSPGRYAWFLSNIQALPQPIPFKGRQKWFDIPDELLTANQTGGAA